MSKAAMDRVTLQDGESANIVNENIEQLKAIFPTAFSEGGVNFDACWVTQVPSTKARRNTASTGTVRRRPARLR